MTATEISTRKPVVLIRHCRWCEKRIGMARFWAFGDWHTDLALQSHRYILDGPFTDGICGECAEEWKRNLRSNPRN